MKKSSLFQASLFLSILILAQSCATVFRRNSVKEIHISSEPSSSEVFLNDVKIGNTPLDFKYKGRKEETLILKKEGYSEQFISVERKINPLWGGISVLGGIPFLGIPILIDYKKGSFYDITSDTIHANMKSKPVVNNPTKTKETVTTGNSLSVNDNIIYIPAMEIITGKRKLIIKPYTRARFYLNNGKKFGGLITAVYDDHFEIRKKGLFVKSGKEDVYFDNMKKARFFSARLWYPILTSPTIIQPIIWYYGGKIAEFDSKKCKRDIKKMTIIEGMPNYYYGKSLKCKM